MDMTTIEERATQDANEKKKYIIHDKLYLGCIGDFGAIERLSGEVTSGNVSHLACQIRGIARRRKEYLMKHSLVKGDKDLLLDQIDVKEIARQEEREKAWVLFSELIDANQCEGYCETFLINKEDFFDQMEEDE